MKKWKFTQRQIATRLGLSEGMVSLLFNGHNMAGSPTAQAIAAVTGKDKRRYFLNGTYTLKKALSGEAIRTEIEAAMTREKEMERVLKEGKRGSN